MVTGSHPKVPLPWYAVTGYVLNDPHYGLVLGVITSGDTVIIQHGSSELCCRECMSVLGAWSDKFFPFSYWVLRSLPREGDLLSGFWWSGSVVGEDADLCGTSLGGVWW